MRPSMRSLRACRVVPGAQAQAALESAAIIFEGVPEVLDLKREVFARASVLAGPDPIIASTTSTILVDELSGSVEQPERFLNAHWLNPAYLVPLVEISPGARTDPTVVARLTAILESIGKVPVVCAARPGYIVPRIQALAMNEAARMVEEGVASADDIDKAIKYGFGFRFAVLGMLEFIDWGGGDILYYASRYLTQALGNERYAAPEIVERNMRDGRIGLRTGKGFLDYENLDVEAYRRERLKAFVGSAQNMVGEAAGALTLIPRTTSEHILQNPLVHHHSVIHRDRRAHHRNVEMSGRIAAGELVGAGGKQEVAGHRAQLRAVGVALIVHRQRLVARAPDSSRSRHATPHRPRGRPRPPDSGASARRQRRRRRCA